MDWKLASAAIVAVAVVAGPAAAAANHIIVRATGPSAKAYPVGKQLPQGARLELSLGDTLTVIGPAKATILQGPGSFVLAAEEDTHPFNRMRFSARRGSPLPRGPWTVAVGESGQICATPRDRIAFWRPEADSDASLEVKAADGQPKTLSWPAQEYTLNWPADLVLTDGATYQVAGRPVTVALIPADTDAASLADELLKRGCTAQLDRLVEQMLVK